MKKYRVFGHANVTVSVVVEVKDGVELSEEEILKKAQKKFNGIHAYLGNGGGGDKLIGVDGDTETIAADEAAVFDDYMPE